jgi:hypothetical protein
MDVDERRLRIANAVYDGVVAGTHADQYLVYYALLVYSQEGVEEYERCAFLRDALKARVHESVV